jgi:alpha-ketoglutaric semialdehyde dehydrogenase
VKQYANLVAGQWVESTTTLTNINPSDLSDVVGLYAEANTATVTDAIAAARTAFPSWSRTTVQHRADALDKIGSEILARREELGRLLAREEGKALRDAIDEVVRAGNIFKYFAGEALRIEGDLLASVRPGIHVEVAREPVGVVGVIAPWNYPIAIPAWKIAPALAFGNCVVFKPSELVPGCGWALAEIMSRSGITAGVFNLVMGKGAVGAELVGSPHVNAITFTGSAATGMKIAQQAVTRLARLQLEMSGKNAQVVLDDADLELAVDCALNSSYFSTGQRCTASSRLIVTAGIHDRFVSLLKEKMRKLVVDDALKPGTDIGPVVDERQLQQDLDYIEIGQKEGAAVFGGKRLTRDKEGYYLEPALFTESTSAMRINQEEIFGPVAAVIRVKDYEEALTVANDSKFGLTAGICTTSLKYATHFKRNVEAGMVMVNMPTAGVDYHVAFGGRKASSYGPREQGAYAKEFFTTVKTAYTFPG